MLDNRIKSCTIVKEADRKGQTLREEGAESGEYSDEDGQAAEGLTFGEFGLLVVGQ